MIEYVVRAPEDPSDDLRALKYPYMACEVLCCDIMSITETLATASEGRIVETMFEFLYQSEPLDSRLAGYFEKVWTLTLRLRISLFFSRIFALGRHRSCRCSWCASHKR